MIRSPVIIFSVWRHRDQHSHFWLQDMTTSVLPLSVVLVLVCSLPSVTLSAPTSVKSLLLVAIDSDTYRVQLTGSLLDFSPVVNSSACPAYFQSSFPVVMPTPQISAVFPWSK